MLDLGFNTERYAVQDLISTEDWAQEMIVGPSQGVIFLFQETEPQRTFATAEKATLNAANNTPNLFYMKQLAHNACGTIALFHVLLNAVDTVPDIIKEGSYLAEFKAKQNKSPNEIGEEFKASKNVEEIHKDASNEGQSEAAERVDSHFIAFIVKDGSLYELDGCKVMPVNHGPCAPDELLSHSCTEIKKFMERDPTNINFSIMVVGNRPE